MVVMPRDPDQSAEIVPFRVRFVCGGNICRSPMAEVLFKKLVSDAGLDDYVATDSAGTGDWHVGERADHRTLATLRRHGFNGDSHRAKQFDPSDFGWLDLIVPLDRSHERILNRWAKADTDRAKIHLLRSFGPSRESDLDVPDPYYGDESMFDRVLGMIEGATTHLFRQLQPAIAQGATR